MTPSPLSEFKAKWVELQHDIKQPKVSSKSKKAIKELLQSCIDAGAVLNDPVDRADLQVLARSIADAVFWTTGEYPDAAILPSQKSIKQAAISQQSRINNIPSPRNALFTGREDILEELNHVLSTAGVVALSGLGGVGKTQTAIEYAYRHADDYSHLLWASADSKTSLINGFTEIARLLDIPEVNARNQDAIVRGVRHWLENNRRWLLILDNADDLHLARDFIVSSGHTLLTTRAQATGEITRVSIDKMSVEDGASLLLRRAKLITNKYGEGVYGQHYETAVEIARELDGLPLAIDQAGAFVETRQLNLNEYLSLYKNEGSKLLSVRGEFTSNHPDSVAKTFGLAFADVERRDPAAANLLRICAFLDSEAIPEEIFIYEPSLFDDELDASLERSLALSSLIEKAARLSLIIRNSDSKTIEIHRLVQAVIKDLMDIDSKRLWADKTVRAVIKSFPPPKPENWHVCDRYLPHVRAAANLIDEWRFGFEGTIELLNQASTYCYDRAQYSEAKSFVEQVLHIRLGTLSEKHQDVAESLHRLALINHRVGRYREAESLYLRSLHIREEILEPGHTDLAMSFNNLAWLYYLQGKYAEAEPLYLKSLAIRENALGTEHPKVAVSLNNLARLYYTQGKYKGSEALYLRSLGIRVNTLGRSHPDVAQCLSNLALLYHTQERHEAAEILYKNALEIYQETVDSDHPDIAQTLNNLGLLYYDVGDFQKAELLLRQALTINQNKLGSEHPEVAQSLNNLAGVYAAYRKFDEAIILAQRALAIRVASLGHEHPYVAISHNKLAGILSEVGKYKDAEMHLLRALEIRRQSFGDEHLDVAETLSSLATLYYEVENSEVADLYMKRAMTIREKILASDGEDISSVSTYMLKYLKGFDAEFSRFFQNSSNHITEE